MLQNNCVSQENSISFLLLMRIPELSLSLETNVDVIVDVPVDLSCRGSDGNK